MDDGAVFVRFENQGVEGVVACGITIAEAGRSFGLMRDLCRPGDQTHRCGVVVNSGIDLLNSVTSTETEHFDKNGRRSNERLACEARIIKPGEIEVMTQESDTQTQKSKSEATSDIHSEFNALPLDKKFASLLQMEATTINEAVKYVADSSMKALEKLGEAISDLGAKVETEAKQAVGSDDSRPEEKGSKAESKRKPSEGKK